MSLAPITPDQWQRAWAVYETVAKLAPAERDARLVELCANDLAVRAAVESMLAGSDRTVTAVQDSGQSETPDDGPTRPGGDGPTGPTGPMNLLGQRLARYHLVRLLGRGGMGVVFLAHDTALGRDVAIKMVNAGPEMTSALARFRDEATTIARLQHPHVVAVYDWGESEFGPYLVMEYVSGASLAGRMAGERLAPAEAAKLVRLLARAVHAAHERGVVHRDLKPANVLLAPAADESALNCEWGCPKVGDFGLARRVDVDSGLSVAGGLYGSPPYMSPEQADGEPGVGPATDIHALGVILYELLTGVRPFRGPALLQSIRNEVPPLPSTLNADVPAQLDAVCAKCLAKKPGDRYATAGELARALEPAAPTIRPVVALLKKKRGLWGLWPISISISIKITIGAAILGVATSWLIQSQLRPAVAVLSPDRAVPVVKGLDRANGPHDPPPPFAVELPKVDDAKADDVRAKAAAEQQAMAKALAERLALGKAEAERIEADRKAEDARLAKIEADKKAEAEHLAEAERLAKIEAVKKAEAERLAKIEADKKAEAARVKAEATAKSTPPGNVPDNVELLHTLKDHRGPVTTIVFHPTDDRLFSGDDLTAGSVAKSPIVAWEILTGTKVQDVDLHRRQTRTLAVSPHGKFVAVGGGPTNTDVILWNAEVKKTEPPMFGQPASSGMRLMFAKDGNTVGSVNLKEQVTVWQPGNPTAVRNKQAKDADLRAHNSVTAVTLRPDRGLLVAASGHKDGLVRIWDAQKETDLRTLTKAHAVAVTDLAFGPDFKRLATCAADGSLRVWDIETGIEALKAEAGPKALRCLAWSPDGGKRLLTGGDDGIVRLWDVATGKELARATGHSGPVTCVAFKPDLSVFASGGEDKSVMVWTMPKD